MPSFILGLIALAGLAGVYYFVTKDKPIGAFFAILIGFASAYALIWRHDISGFWSVLPAILYFISGVLIAATALVVTDWDNVTTGQGFLVTFAGVFSLLWLVLSIVISWMFPLTAAANQPWFFSSWSFGQFSWLVLPIITAGLIGGAWFFYTSRPTLSYVLAGIGIAASVYLMVSAIFRDQTWGAAIFVAVVSMIMLLVAALMAYFDQKILSAIFGITGGIVLLAIAITVVFTVGRSIINELTSGSVAGASATPIPAEATQLPVVVEPESTPLPPPVIDIPAVQPPAEQPPAPVSILLPNSRTSGAVDYNYDGGDSKNGVIINITKDDPVSNPTVFLVVPTYSIDVEYDIRMYFTADMYDGTASLNQATDLAKTLYPSGEQYIFVGPENQTPNGWTHWSKASGWWKVLKAWKFSVEAIQPKGLNSGNGIFIGRNDPNRTITCSGVCYGQFWKPDDKNHTGHVVHFQFRSGTWGPIPTGWEGTYWDWTGDFNTENEIQLQQRMIQATFTEVVNRDDIKKVDLFVCGILPEVDPNFTSFDFNGNHISWNAVVNGWTCK